MDCCNAAVAQKVLVENPRSIWEEKSEAWVRARQRLCSAEFNADAAERELAAARQEEQGAWTDMERAAGRSPVVGGSITGSQVR